MTSIAKLGRFLGEKAEEAGVYLLSETSADKLLVEDRIVRGVRSGDKGRGRDGEELPTSSRAPTSSPGPPCSPRGPSGHLTGAALDYFDLHGLPARSAGSSGSRRSGRSRPLDRVIHTMGWPLRERAKYNEFGGRFIYPMGEDKVSIGLVVGLDYTDATFSVHDALQELKTHPFVRKILEGGKRVAWGAKTIPSGRLLGAAARLTVPGMVMAGDNAGMVNVPELKGIHYAMHAGMYAAETIVEALKPGLGQLRGLRREGPQERDRGGPLPLAQHAPVVLEGVLRGRRGRQRMTITSGAFRRRALEAGGRRRGGDADREGGGRLPEARQQVHLRQALLGVRLGQRDPRRRAQPHPGPAPGPARGRPDLGLDVPGAGLRDPRGAARERRPGSTSNVTASNCVQCGAITAKGGRLTPPEGGDGPLYQET